MSRDFGGWSCKRASVCGGFTLSEIVDATSDQWRIVGYAQQAHLEWHEDYEASQRAQAATAHGVAL